MKILITGNMGYVGPGVISRLRETYPNADLVGFDIGYFANNLTGAEILPEVKLNKQIIGDVRYVTEDLLEGVDCVIYLAAISNDPMGNTFEDITMDVNYKSAIKFASMAKSRGAGSFIFASSCSMYGAADDHAKVESDELKPLTTYARSKVAAEKDLKPLASDDFTITCWRFATACGYSNRLRLDLVLNDFVAGAVATKQIGILSDGTPWRPLIHVLDMAVAIDWAVNREAGNGGSFLAINTGSNVWNYQVAELAGAVAKIIPDTAVSVNPDAPPDKRSYKVNFDRYERLAPNHQPKFTLDETIDDLYGKLSEMGFSNAKFRESQYIRLKTLDRHQKQQLLNDNLSWNF
jgi:nucleoside-diphosphate-sugar epimerase